MNNTATHSLIKMISSGQKIQEVLLKGHTHITFKYEEVKQHTSSRLHAQQTAVGNFGFVKQPLINVHLQTPIEVNMSTHANKAAVKLFYLTIW